MRSLSENFPVSQFGEAGDAEETIRLMNILRWNMVILDINLPGSNGLYVLKRIKENYPEIPVIIFSMYPEDQFAVRSIRSGASAYLSKNISMTEFVAAIRSIISGERYLTSSLMELISNELNEDHFPDSHKTLSDREYQVFMLIASGENLSRIAKDLNLSVKTVSVYRSHILQKMSLRNNSEITHYAFRHNLVN